MKIIIPAYEPDNRLLNLIKEIKANSNHDIIIINDGSGSDCVAIFQEASKQGCTILIHDKNRGKGAALKTAFQYLIDNDNTEGLICADCDGQHTWQDIQKVADALLLPSNNIILGCRKFVGTVPFKSRFGNKLTRAIYTLITGNKIRDTQTGLRGFQSDMLPWLVELEGCRYEYEMNQLLHAKKAGYRFQSIPIETIYEDNNAGSHFHPIRDSIRVYLPIIKFSMSSITCGAIDVTLLFLLKRLTNNLLLSVVGARITSSLCNYLFNKHLVFDAKGDKKSSTLVQYYLLVLLILSLNYLLMKLFNEILDLPLLLSKLFTEGLLFGFSYMVQQKLIFKKNYSK